MRFRLDQALRLALCWVALSSLPGCAAWSGREDVRARNAKNYTPSNGMRADVLVELLGPPDRADHRDGRDVYTWSYSEPTLDHPVLIWIPVGGFYYTSVTMRVYTLVVTCHDDAVVAVDTSHAGVKTGF